MRHAADIRSVAAVTATLAFMALQWSGVVRHPLLVPLTALLAFMSCVVNHNHQHMATFSPTPLNRLFGCLLSLAIGQPAVAIVPMHNLNHHRHNNTSRDFVRASQVRWRWPLLNLFAFPFVAMAGYARAKSEEMRRWRESSPRLWRQLVLERWIFYPTLLALLALRPLETLLYVVVPYLAGQWAIVAVNLVQHQGCDPDSEYDHSRNFTGPLLNWLLFNNGFHTAHHLRPGLHWSGLPAYHAEIRDVIDPSLECRSLLATLFTMYVRPGRARPLARPKPSDYGTRKNTS